MAKEYNRHLSPLPEKEHIGNHLPERFSSLKQPKQMEQCTGSRTYYGFSAGR